MTAKNPAISRLRRRAPRRMVSLRGWTLATVIVVTFLCAFDAMRVVEALPRQILRIWARRNVARRAKVESSPRSGTCKGSFAHQGARERAARDGSFGRKSTSFVTSAGTDRRSILSRPSSGAPQRPNSRSDRGDRVPERTDPDTVWHMQPVPSTPLTTEEIPVERAPSASATREHARPLESGSTGLPVPSPSTRSRVSRIELARKNAVLTILGSVFVAMLALFIVEQLSPGLFAGLRNVSTQGGRGVSGTTKTSSTQTTRPP